MTNYQFKRQENKYFINSVDYQNLKNDISKVMRQDDYCFNNTSYKVRSLYFDNFDYKCIDEKLSGEKNRSKYRIRVYNNNFNNIKLEVKIKNNSVSFKKSFKVDKDFCNKIINGYDLDLENIIDKDLKKEIIFMKHNWYKPANIINYERDAFLISKNFFRVTFDKNLTTELSNYDFFNINLQKQKIFLKDYVVLEVKYRNSIPKVVADVIEKYPMARSAISKYVLGYKFRDFTKNRDSIREPY